MSAATDQPPGRSSAPWRAALRAAVVGTAFGRRLALFRDHRRADTVDRALRRGPGSGLVVDTMYRAVLGRLPSPEERAGMRRSANDGAGWDELVAGLEGSQEGVDRAVARMAPVLESKLRRQFNEGHTPAPRLVFLHIMKVGGTSLSDLIQRWVGVDRSRVHIFVDDLILTSPLLLTRLGLLAGHFPYEALSLVPHPYSTLCVLREPVARTLSHYSQLRTARIRYRDLSLDEFVFSEEFDVPSGNYQARQLAHEIGLAEAWRSFTPDIELRAAGGDPELGYPVQALFDSTPLRFDEATLLHKASENLAQIDFVGVTESLDAVGAAVARLFGATPEPAQRLNASVPVARGDIERRIVRRIEERTAVDRELYEAAVRRTRDHCLTEGFSPPLAPPVCGPRRPGCSCPRWRRTGRSCRLPRRRRTCRPRPTHRHS